MKQEPCAGAKKGILASLPIDLDYLTEGSNAIATEIGEGEAQDLQ